MRYLNYSICTLAGLLLFGIGIIGITELPVQPSTSITLLLEPLGAGSQFDLLYWEALIALGVWLTLCFWVRVPAGIALCLIIGKIGVLKGYVPLNTAMVIVAIFCVVIIGWQTVHLYNQYSNS